MSKPSHTPYDLTPWFPERITPVRVGVYQVGDIEEDGRWYSYWNGERFGYRTCMGAEHAYSAREMGTSRGPLAPWRGLARKP